MNVAVTTLTLVHFSTNVIDRTVNLASLSVSHGVLCKVCVFLKICLHLQKHNTMILLNVEPWIIEEREVNQYRDALKHPHVQILRQNMGYSCIIKFGPDKQSFVYQNGRFETFKDSEKEYYTIAQMKFMVGIMAPKSVDLKAPTRRRRVKFCVSKFFK